MSLPRVAVFKKELSKKERTAVLALEDGSYFIGTGFGATGKVCGEVVFNTGMVGYPEALTDPSYEGQILVLTYPLIGNYGVPPWTVFDRWMIPSFFESDSIKVEGLVVHEYCSTPHHWQSQQTLGQWLEDEGVPGVQKIDTRMLTKKLREHGVMLGVLEVFEENVEPDLDRLINEAKRVPDPNDLDLVSKVTCKEPIIYNNLGRKRVVVIDCGVKYNILRELLHRGVDVVRIPYNFSAEEIMEYKPSGILITNGPGNPKKVQGTIATVSTLIENNVPVMGICFGNQIVSLACGGDTYKLKYGHRSQNQPCVDVNTGRCYITTQNHGYAVSLESLKNTGLEVWFLNVNDKTVEGVKHKKLSVFSVQFHPEHSAGPVDSEYIFDIFLNMLESA
ncbi:MAG: glutamine-hydrolyzing carbamoyl-phosphate synthase small subunit [Candidatus Freyarchaeota archaeon]|nr:glutamine-hydrolyzing carbamoyl-phosphate synthase small subunit [Candidatus Jordarchaeia archaeon]MBS7268542.1 glutamine-hydrolyzing carbamoyl-phosphate synthase small subunit [Candidatus Jordarchaeia archaeon]